MPRAYREILVYDGFQSCPYLPGRVARMPLRRQLRPLDLEDADLRFAAGDRRVGGSLYRTTCPTCAECKPLRVLVDDFKPTKSQRRAANRWSGRGRVEYGPVTCSDEKLILFNRHKFERDLADPEQDPPMTSLSYMGWLGESCFHTMEMRYYLEDRLVGVGILDLGKEGASSVYFYFDPSPEVARLSPGVWSTLQEIEFCRRTGRKYLYLGLYVRDCTHLAYKAGYFPHERLVDGDWRRFEPPASV
jgi:arginyl-tRNA--protein-N-Asp/Glu arginylyltransferase